MSYPLLCMTGCCCCLWALPVLLWYSVPAGWESYSNGELFSDWWAWCWQGFCFCIGGRYVEVWELGGGWELWLDWDCSVLVSFLHMEQCAQLDKSWENWDFGEDPGRNFLMQEGSEKLKNESLTLKSDWISSISWLVRPNPRVCRRKWESNQFKFLYIFIQYKHYILQEQKEKSRHSEVDKFALMQQSIASGSCSLCVYLNACDVLQALSLDHSSSLVLHSALLCKFWKHLLPVAFDQVRAGFEVSCHLPSPVRIPDSPFWSSHGVWRRRTYGCSGIGTPQFNSWVIGT